LIGVGFPQMLRQSDADHGQARLRSGTAVTGAFPWDIWGSVDLAGVPR
jgi:hypothetical protein